MTSDLARTYLPIHVWHADDQAAMSWSLRGDLDRMRSALVCLTEPELDEVMRAAALLVAVAGGLDVEQLVERSGG